MENVHCVNFPPQRKRAIPAVGLTARIIATPVLIHRGIKYFYFMVVSVKMRNKNGGVLYAKCDYHRCRQGSWA